MINTHEQEKKQFKRLFAQQGVDQFDLRFQVLEAFLKLEHHVTIQEIISQLEKDGVLLDPSFVLNSMELLCRFGFASKNRFDNGVVRYEHFHLGQHHDHMICTKCKGIFEFQNNRLENLQLQIAASRGFHMLQHRMEIYGICSDCLRDRTRTMPLGAAKQGERLVINHITGGSGAQMRLLTMGLRIGDKVEVITNQNRGQMVIAVDFKRFVLGKGLADKILVEQDT